MFFQQHETISDVAAKASPVVAASGINMFTSITLPDIIQYVSLLYAVLLAVDKLYVMYVRYRDARKNAPKE